MHIRPSQLTHFIISIYYYTQNRILQFTFKNNNIHHPPNNPTSLLKPPSFLIGIIPQIIPTPPHITPTHIHFQIDMMHTMLTDPPTLMTTLQIHSPSITNLKPSPTFPIFIPHRHSMAAPTQMPIGPSPVYF
jgi:hypothetical protein